MLAYNRIPKMDICDFSKVRSVCTGAEILLPGWGLPLELKDQVRAVQEAAGQEDEAYGNCLRAGTWWDDSTDTTSNLC